MVNIDPAEPRPLKGISGVGHELREGRYSGGEAIHRLPGAQGTDVSDFRVGGQGRKVRQVDLVPFSEGPGQGLLRLVELWRVIDAMDVPGLEGGKEGT